MIKGKTILKTETTTVSGFTQQMKIHFTDGTSLVVSPSPLKGLYLDSVGTDGRHSGIHPANLNS